MDSVRCGGSVVSVSDVGPEGLELEVWGLQIVSVNYDGIKRSSELLAI